MKQTPTQRSCVCAALTTFLLGVPACTGDSLDITDTLMPKEILTEGSASQILIGRFVLSLTQYQATEPTLHKAQRAIRHIEHVCLTNGERFWA